MSAAARAATAKVAEEAQKAAEDAKLAAGGGNIVVVMTRLQKGVHGADRQTVRLKLSKETKLKQIKARIDLELGIPRSEQNIYFRGKLCPDDEGEPLNSPDLETIVEEAGDAGLNMAVHHVPQKLNAFLEREFDTENGAAKVKDKFPTKASALHRAVRRCDISVCGELLRNETFDLFDAKDNKGQTALHTAVTCNFLEIATMILQCPRFTDVGAKDSEGKTALHYAAFFGDARMCKRILEHPKRARQWVVIKDKLGNTALAYAVHTGHDEAADVILKYFPDLQRPRPLCPALGATDGSVSPRPRASPRSLTMKSLQMPAGDAEAASASPRSARSQASAAPDVPSFSVLDVLAKELPVQITQDDAGEEDTSPVDTNGQLNEAPAFSLTVSGPLTAAIAEAHAVPQSEKPAGDQQSPADAGDKVNGNVLNEALGEAVDNSSSYDKWDILGAMEVKRHSDQHE
jgi:hypothetical protein